MAKFYTEVRNAQKYGYTHLKAANGQITPLNEITKRMTPENLPCNGWVFYHHSYTEPRILSLKSKGYFELLPKPEPCKHEVVSHSHCNECGIKLNETPRTDGEKRDKTMSEQAEVMQAFLHSPSHAVQIREEYGLKDEAEEIFAALLALAED